MLRVAGWWRREVARTVGEHGGRSRRRSSRNAVGVVGRLLVCHVGCGRSKPRCCGCDTWRRRCSKLSTRSTGRGRERLAALGASLPSRMRHQLMHSSGALGELHGQVDDEEEQEQMDNSSCRPSTLSRSNLSETRRWC